MNMLWCTTTTYVLVASYDGILQYVIQQGKASSIIMLLEEKYRWCAVVVALS